MWLGVSTIWQKNHARIATFSFNDTGMLGFLIFSKLHYLIHELYLTNHLSFPELLNCGTRCHPLLSLNPTICHLLNLTSTKLILSPFSLKLSLIFSVFPLSRLCYRPYGLPRHYLLEKKTAKSMFVRR